MTSKRKQIIEALGKNGLSTMDELGFHTGIIRKSLHDNVKAAIQDGLVERTMDDITNQPAYILTKKGRDWLPKNASEVSGDQPQPAVGDNTGSDGSAPRVAGSAVVAEPPAEAVTVIEPPKPDYSPAAVRSDAMPTDKACCNAAKVVAKTAGDVVQRLNEQIEKQSLDIETLRAALLGAQNHGNKLQKDLNEAYAAIDSDQDQIKKLLARIASLESNGNLPINAAGSGQYIVTDCYGLATSASEANNLAIDMAKAAPSDCSVLVFEYTKARELRINWRDA